MQARSVGSWPGPFAGPFNYDLMVTAGGGGGSEGGGGAGGLRLLTTQPGGPGTYPVTIGGGGAMNVPGHSNPGSKGEDSIFGCITSTGGGLGAYHAGGGGCGGSGGGSGHSPVGRAAGVGNVPPIPAPLGGPQGNPGGVPQGGPTYNNAGAGGGRASAGSHSAGGAGLDVQPTFGCAPQPYYPVPGPGEGYFAGGGGSRNESPGSPPLFAGGIGGGGTGFNAVPGIPAPSKTGVVNSGGGGGAYHPGCLGSGGSGIVLVKIPAPVTPFASVTPGCNALVATPSGSVAKFTVTGTLVIV